ncbi:hypothetical protein QCA50_005156 [Cerrena zonata]|uniref:Rho termination factor-like N-terminal domain-containing protein n=1 Tax=Cerrena zonata TaxID=2478898 RepID=A0AAW0GEP8_9APHY
MDRPQLEKLTVKQLHVYAHQYEIKIGKKRKGELIDELLVKHPHGVPELKKTKAKSKAKPKTGKSSRKSKSSAKASPSPEVEAVDDVDVKPEDVAPQDVEEVPPQEVVEETIEDVVEEKVQEVIEETFEEVAHQSPSSRPEPLPQSRSSSPMLSLPVANTSSQPFPETEQLQQLSRRRSPTAGEMTTPMRMSRRAEKQPERSAPVPPGGPIADPSTTRGQHPKMSLSALIIQGTESNLTSSQPSIRTSEIEEANRVEALASSASPDTSEVPTEVPTETASISKTGGGGEDVGRPMLPGMVDNSLTACLEERGTGIPRRVVYDGLRYATDLQNTVQPFQDLLENLDSIQEMAVARIYDAGHGMTMVGQIRGLVEEIAMEWTAGLKATGKDQLSRRLLREWRPRTEEDDEESENEEEEEDDWQDSDADDSNALCLDGIQHRGKKRARIEYEEEDDSEEEEEEQEEREVRPMKRMRS